MGKNIVRLCKDCKHLASTTETTKYGGGYGFAIEAIEFLRCRSEIAPYTDFVRGHKDPHMINYCGQCGFYESMI